jgi:hypothetical protein
MQNISALLEKFKRFSKPNIEVREAVSRTIKSEIGAIVSEKDISLKNGIVLIKTHNSVLKNEIFLKKKKILSIIQDLFRDAKIVDIK